MGCDLLQPVELLTDLSAVTGISGQIDTLEEDHCRHHGLAQQDVLDVSGYRTTRQSFVWQVFRPDVHHYRGERIGFTELPGPPPKASPAQVPTVRAVVPARKPKPDHPWRQGYQNMKPRLAHQPAAASLVGMRAYASP